MAPIISALPQTPVVDEPAQLDVDHLGELGTGDGIGELPALLPLVDILLEQLDIAAVIARKNFVPRVTSWVE